MNGRAACVPRTEMGDGFSISVTRTIAADPERLLAAFTNPTIRKRWLPEAGMRQRPTRAALSARFDWAEPASRVVVTVAAKGPGRGLVAVAHEKLPDATAAKRSKAAGVHPSTPSRRSSNAPDPRGPSRRWPDGPAGQRDPFEEDDGDPRSRPTAMHAGGRPDDRTLWTHA